MFIGAVIIDALYETGEPLEMAGGKYKLGESIPFKDGSHRTYQDVEYQYRPKTFLPEIIGGGGGNTGLSFGFLRHAHGLDANCIVATKLGGGPQSQEARRQLQARGVFVSDALHAPRFNTMTNFVISGTDDRCILVDGRAYPDIYPGYEQELRHLIAQTDIIFVHTRIPDLALLGARIACEMDKTVIIDASSYDETFERILPYATHAFPPDEIILPSMNGEKNPHALMQYLGEFENIEYAAVTCGKDPTLLRRDDGSLQLLEVQASDDFQVIDRLAAGDVTRAVIVEEMIRQHIAGEPNDIEKAIRRGMLHGTFSAGFLGRDWEREYNPDTFKRVTGAKYPFSSFNAPEPHFFAKADLTY